MQVHSLARTSVLALKWLAGGPGHARARRASGCRRAELRWAWFPAALLAFVQLRVSAQEAGSAGRVPAATDQATAGAGWRVLPQLCVPTLTLS